MENCAIVLCGGSGERFGGKKQFIKFAGKTLWEHVYDKIVNILPKENIVVVGIDIEGGKTRSGSVINGLNYLYNSNKSYQKVIILESARPLVTEEQINQLLNQTDKSATFIFPLVNTVIKRNGTYQNREDFYELLTPQCFDFNMLHNAYKQKTEWNMTDETRVMYEIYGIKPQFIMGGENLLKLTYKKDLPILETLWNMQQEALI